MVWKAFPLTAALLIFCSTSALAGDMNVTFVDVGYGEAIYVESPEGTNALVDTGDEEGTERLLDFLKARDADRLDALIITHLHPDHMGGLPRLIESVPVNARYDNGQAIEKGDGLYRDYALHFRQGAYVSVKAGDVITLGSVTLEVLSPEVISGEPNADSLVMRVKYGETSVLLMSDPNTEVENALMRKGVNLNAEVLKVGHHGAADATGSDFLKGVSPQYAVISVDEENVNAYPSSEIVERIAKTGITLFITWRDGNVTFVSDGNNIERKPL